MTDRARDDAARFAVDDRELDEAFSAWDEDDALARRPPVGGGAEGTGSAFAETRLARRSAAPPAPPAGTDPPPEAAEAAQAARISSEASPMEALRKLVDPVSMHDIVLSRARTLDDPLTTRVLAEITRAEAAAPERAPRPAGTAPLPTTPSASLDVIVTDPEHVADDARVLPRSEDLAEPLRRATRRSVPRLRDEPFRKK